MIETHMMSLAKHSINTERERKGTHPKTACKQRKVALDGNQS